MMPDLGKYAFEVLTAYAVSLALLAGLVVWTMVQARRMRRSLEDFEARRGPRGTGRERSEKPAE